MSATADALNMRIKISDPKPAYCSGCYQAAQEGITFLDFDAAHDGGAFINDQGATLVGQDDLHLCEPCVRSACEALGLKPELHSRQAREIRRLELERDHWKDYAKRAEATIATRPKETPHGK
jgi:hypothetical protein